MAEGVHHRDGAPAILVATIGPGLMNGVNVIANAHQDRVPLIVLSGCVDAHEAQSYTHQVVDHRAVLAPVTKATFTLDPAGAGIVADKAVAVATEPRAGPVLIDVPISAADAPGREYAPVRAAPAPVAPAGAGLATARDWLAGAERPVILAGLDVLADGAAAALARFAEAQSVPVITTYKAKGVLPEDHPLGLGAAGLSPLADRHLLPFVASADLVLCLGYDPIEMRTGWRDPWDPRRQRVIDVHAAPNHHYMHHASLSFLAHCGAALDALGEGLAARPRWPGGEPQALRAALAGAFPADEAWGAAAVIAEARDVLPADAVATVDSGAHRILLSQMWRCAGPRLLLQSSGLCTMGCAVPLAIGAKLAEPDRPVVAFTGDAGLLMVAGELATAAETGAAPVVVVFSDASLALIEMKQRQRQLANHGVDFARQDFAALARALGGRGASVSSRAELRAALEEALDADRFTVISAEIGRQDYDGRI
jgi:acetolactate synthase-1/2/3 large subunit